MFDYYQSKQDQHGLGTKTTEKDNPIWIGSTVDQTLLSHAVHLRTIFRTTGKIARYIGDQCLVPDWRIGDEDGEYKITHNIQGIAPDVRNIKLERLDDDFVKQKLLTEISLFIEKSVQSKNHHPGHIATTLPVVRT